MLGAGTRLGTFEVIGPLGAGGMGAVYRARDTRLGREIALKVLPDLFASDPDRVARFEREAQLLASLNHPNIAAIHGLADAAGTYALVLELVPGETLAERIDKGPLPLDETLRIARQIIEAVDAAHEQGIVHRDLKPANIKITPDGKVKVLDFGLAKLAETSSGGLSATPAQMATVTSPALMTGVGMVLGTAAYMSPEQARGQLTDKRADIWAFGCIVYEMLTGRRLFDGATVTDALSNVLTREPDWTAVPATFRSLLQSCLERDPKRRLRDIGDAWRLIDQPRDPDGPRRRGLWLAAAATGIAALAVVVAVMIKGRTAESSTRPSPRLVLDLGREASFDTDFPMAALSPDGTRIVFISKGAAGIVRLATRRLDQPETTVLPGTEAAYFPFFSPDGEWVGFFAGGKLKKTRLDGGMPIVLCDASAGRGASWGEDGHIIAALDNRAGLSLVAASGGAVTQVTKLESGEITHRWPQFLPGAKAVVFTVGAIPGNYARASIAVASAGSGAEWTKKIVATNVGMAPRYVSTGHLTYISNGTFYAIPFDKDRLETRGVATAVLEDVSVAIGFGSAQFDVARNGTALYRIGQTAGRTIVQWLDASGKTEPLWDDPGFYQTPQLSPDGNRILSAISDGVAQDVWVYDWRRGSRTRVTSGLGVGTNPIWTPDNQSVVFYSSGHLYSARADGAERPQVLASDDERVRYATSFSADGTKMLLLEVASGGVESHLQVAAVDRRSGQLRLGKPELFRRLNSGAPSAVFSPDGRWIAYASPESGPYEVYVRAFPDTGRQWQISTNGGIFPLWSRTANELFYRTEDQLIMVASYTVENGSFTATRPRVWSQTRLFNTGLVQNFDLAPDGKRFAVLTSAGKPETQEAPRAMLVLNFFDEIRRRVDGAKPGAR
jgi:serine/threonine-protein kinase